MPYCVAVGCSVRKSDKAINPPITFHQFPIDKELREKWVQVIRRENWEPTNRSQLCSNHFKEEDFDRSPFYSKLNKGVIPSRFPSFPAHLKQNEPRAIKQCASPLINTRSLSKKRHESTLLNQSNVVIDLNNQLASTSQQLKLSGEEIAEQNGSTHNSGEGTSNKPYASTSTSRSQTCQIQFPKKGTDQKIVKDVSVQMNEHPMRARTEDHFDMIGKTFAIKLRGLPKQQMLLAERLMNETLFQAEMGCLTYSYRLSSEENPHHLSTWCSPVIPSSRENPT